MDWTPSEPPSGDRSGEPSVPDRDGDVPFEEGGDVPELAPPAEAPGTTQPHRVAQAHPAATAIVALVSAAVGALMVLLALPYVAPLYVARLNPPQIPVAPTPPAVNGSAAVAVFRQVAPAVVAIENRSVRQGFFGQAQVREGTGSGVIFTSSGYIVTNYHVVAGAQQLTVILATGQHIAAKVVGVDPPTDLAVVKVNAGHALATAQFADSSRVVPGETAIAIGNPLGLDLSQTVTVGVVSGVRTMLYGYSAQDQRDTRLIQTDAAINPGNSGGPLCNAAGEVIGLNTWKVASVPNEGIPAEGIGFAVPSNTVRSVADDLVRYGYVRRAYLGVSLLNTANGQQGMGSCLAGPLQVSQVQAGGPAARAGIRQGDFIVSFNGHEVKSYCDLVVDIDAVRPGETVPVGVLRGNRRLTVRVTLGQLPRAQG